MNTPNRPIIGNSNKLTKTLPKSFKNTATTITANTVRSQLTSIKTPGATATTPIRPIPTSKAYSKLFS